MPRFPSPVAPAGTERLVRTLMVAYKGRDQVVPVCKVWLDGAGEAPLPATRLEASVTELAGAATLSMQCSDCLMD